MNLQSTIQKITGENVTSEEAMAYARDNFPRLVSYLRGELLGITLEQDARIKQ